MRMLPTPRSAAKSGLSDEDRANPDDYRALHSSTKDFHLAVSPLAAALKDNGGGRLMGTEFEPSKVQRARENLTAAGLSDLVRFRKAMHSRPSRAVCRIGSISFFSMESRRFT